MKFLEAKLRKLLKIILLISFLLSNDAIVFSSKLKLSSNQLDRSKYVSDKEMDPSQSEWLKNHLEEITKWDKDLNEHLMRFKQNNDSNNQKKLEETYRLHTQFLDYRKSFSSTDLKEIYPYHANAGTFSTNGWSWWDNNKYPATNAISGRYWSNTDDVNGNWWSWWMHRHSTWYWLSAENVNNDWWECLFNRDEGVDLMYIDWVYPPQKFSVSFTGKKGEIYVKNKDDLPQIALPGTNTSSPINNPSVYNTLIFRKQIVPSKVRIAMFGHYRYSRFGINDVNFYKLRKTVIIRNQGVDISKDWCLYLNTDIPLDYYEMEVHECVKAVSVGNNNELFYFENNNTIQLYNRSWNFSQQRWNTWCLGFSNANNLSLWNCSQACDYSQINYDITGMVTFDRYKDDCWVLDTSQSMSKNYITEQSEIRATTQLDNQTFKVQNIRIAGDTIWHSAIGQTRATIHIVFGKKQAGNVEVKKVDLIKISWVKAASDFRVFTWRPNHGWEHRATFTNNKDTNVDVQLTAVECSGIMIIMDKALPSQETNNYVAYSIKDIYVGSNSYQVKKQACSEAQNKFKIFDFDEQSNKATQFTNSFRNIWAQMTRNWDSLVSIYYKLKITSKFIQKSKGKAQDLLNMLTGLKENIGNTYISQISAFETDELQNIQNSTFSSYIDKYRTYDTGLLYQMTSKGESTQTNDKFAPKLGTFDSPAIDCVDLRAKIPNSSSGYYYIKPICSENPLRVFCDFSIYGNAVDFYFFNNDLEEANPDLNYLGIKDLNGIKYYCATKGLFPLEIQNPQMINRIQQLLQMRNYDLSKDIAIPIGFDYSCSKLPCPGRYNSLNNQNSRRINDFFNNDKKKQNIGAAANSYQNKNFAGFYRNSNREMNTFSLSDVILGGFFCSTNKSKKDPSDDLILHVDCDDKISDYGNKFVAGGKPVVAKCPAYCEKTPLSIYGSNIYHEDSPICLAAVHNGALKQEGGFVKIILTKYDGLFISEDKNGLTSLSKPRQKNARAFNVIMHKPECPMSRVANADSFAQLQTSFIEEDFDYHEKAKNDLSFIRAAHQNIDTTIPKTEAMRFSQTETNQNQNQTNQINQGLNRPTPSSDNITGNIVSGTSDNRSAIQRGSDSVSNVSSTVDSAVGSAMSTLDNTMNGVRSAANGQINQIDASLKEAQKVQGEADDDSASTTPTIKAALTKSQEKALQEPMSTDTAISLTKIIRESNHKFVDNIKQKGTQISAFYTVLDSGLQWAQPKSQLSVESLQQKFFDMVKYKQLILRAIKKMENKSKLRMQLTKKIGVTWKNMVLQSMRYLSWTIEYSMTLQEQMNFLYSVEEFNSDNKVDSQWSYQTKNTKGRAKTVGTITQFTNKKYLGASFFLANRRQFYDTFMSIDILLLHNIGTCGIVFRYVNLYNYYALVIHQGGTNPAGGLKKGTIALYKVVYGQAYPLKKIEQGGLTMNTWYNVVFKLNQGLFKIVIQSSEPNTAPIKISANDSTHVTGTAGVFVNGIKGFMFDKFVVSPLNCSNAYVPKKEVSVITSSANKYTENFKGGLESKYLVLDPNGLSMSSKWSMSATTGYNKGGLSQNSLISDDSGNRRPAILLHRKLFIREGTATVCTIPKTSYGSLSLIFKYQMNENGERFFSFDVTNEKTTDGKNSNYITLRLFQDGLVKTLSTIQNLEEIPDKINRLTELGFKGNSVICLRAETWENKVQTYISQNYGPYVLIAEYEGNDMEFGQVGFGTNKLVTRITEFNLEPRQQELTSLEKSYILKSQFDDIPFPGTLNVTEESKTDPIKSQEGKVGKIRPDDKDKKRNIPNQNYGSKWDVCFKTTKSDKRASYCKNTLSFRGDEINNCVNSFCSKCCDKLAPKKENMQCLKACGKTYVPNNDKKELINTCILGNGSNNTLAGFLSQNEQSTNKNEQKKSGCRLCCSTSKLWANKDFKDTDIFECMEKCDEKYGNSAK